MHTKRWLQSALFLLALAALCGATTHAQTDISASIYGAFTGSTTYSNLLHQRPADAAGGLVEIRHIHNPLVGYEVTYSFHRANQVYTYTGGVPAGGGPVLPVAVSANAHEITGDWLISARAASFRPFALAGVGVLLNEPASGQSDTQSSSTAVYVYGVGVDWRLLPRIGLRLQYRGNVYKAPWLTKALGPGNGSPFNHTAEPMIGAYFRF